MSIVTTLLDLKEFIESNLDVQTEIGEKDIAADNYPFVLLIPDVEGEVQERFGKNAKNVEFPILIRILSHRKNEIEAIGILDKLLTSERLFKPELKNELTTIKPEYTENTYLIDCVYKLNNFIRKSV